MGGQRGETTKMTDGETIFDLMSYDGKTVAKVKGDLVAEGWEEMVAVASAAEKSYSGGRGFQVELAGQLC